VNKQPRYYQIEFKNAVHNGLARGVKRQLGVMPGGTGKTKSAVDIISGMGRRLWITHEESLLEQSAIALLEEMEIMDINILKKTIADFGGLLRILKTKSENFYENVIRENIGIIKADMFDIDKPIVMASAQTLHNRLDKIPADHFNVIVVDEADLFFSKTFIAPLHYFTYDLLLGLTATPYRNDGVMMDDLFEELIYEYKIEQAIKDGFLCELNAIVVKTSTNLDSVHTIGGDFNQKELTEKVNTPERNLKIVDKYIEYCSGQQFICFGADVQHTIDLCEAFNERGIKTEFVVSDTSLTLDRKGTINKYRSGEIIGLCNVGILTAGFDVPNTGCVILARPTKSKRLFLQQLFRVTRLKGKDFVAKFGQIGTILDIVDGTSKHKLVNTHELDKELPIEERVFTSSANKQKLIDARNERMMTNVKEEKKVVLFPLPKIRAKFGNNANDPISIPQQEWLQKRGYDTTSNTYNKYQFNTIFFASPASKADVELLRDNGYDVSGYVSIGQAEIIKKEILTKVARANTERLKKEGKL